MQEKKTYRYDLHSHTIEGSKCGKMTGYESAELHARLGFDGFAVTDHFFNGSSKISKKLPWDEMLDIYFSGYEHAREAGEKLGISVFSGIEAFFSGTEILAYGVPRAWLTAHPACDLWNLQAWCDMLRAQGAFLSQAHPFRQRRYIPDIRVYMRGEVHALETLNAAHTGAQTVADRQADFIAETSGLLRTAGSDAHAVTAAYFAGLEFDYPIRTDEELVAALFRGDGRVFCVDAEGKDIPLYDRPDVKA